MIRTWLEIVRIVKSVCDSEFQSRTGAEISASYFYDEKGDILYVSFCPGEKGTGVELNDNILPRLCSSQD